MLLFGGEASDYKDMVFGKFYHKWGKKSAFNRCIADLNFLTERKLFILRKKTMGRKKKGNVMKRLELSDIVKTRRSCAYRSQSLECHKT